MNGIRRLMCFLMAVVLVAFALPGMAASSTKTFYAVFPEIIQGGSNVAIKVTFYNNTPPPGISTINSLKIVPPPGGTVTFVSPYATPGTPALQPDGSLIINNIPGIKKGKSLEFTVYANITGNCATGTWGALANTGNAFPQGDFFQPVEAKMQLNSGLSCDGALYCNTAGTPFSFSDANVSALRGKFNKDGSPCVKVAYDYTTYIGMDTTGLPYGPNTIHVEWSPSQLYAAFMYNIEWGPTSIAMGEWPTKRPWVAWKESAPGVPEKVPGLPCVSAALPEPLARLKFDVDASQTTIDVTDVAAVLPPVPFPAVINTERVNVTDVSSPTSWTVERGRGGTAAATHTTITPQTLPLLPFDTYLMSTPLPVMPKSPEPNFADFPAAYQGNQAQICIVEHGFTTVGIEPITGRTLVQYLTTAIDIGDGYVGIE